MSESVDGSLQSTKFVEIYNENKTKLTKIPYSFFFKGILLIKVIKKSKGKNKKKITLFS